MGHRGPDERNLYTWNTIELYHLRLTILDAEGGKQPMHLNDKYSIIFNGEIYNHSELRKKHNLNAKTASDTETLLLLYEKLGLDFLNDVDGMFAIALLDKTKNKLLLARDRAGKKPIYFYNNNNQFLFASELNALKSHLELEIEKKHIQQYLRLGSFYGKNTPYKNIDEVQAATILIIDMNTNTIKENKFWNIDSFYQKPKIDNEQEVIAQVDDHLHTAVKRRIESSDLEVGSFLSGGIDSGIVTAIGKQYNSKLKTFTVSFDGAYDESALAKLVADKYETDHHQIKINLSNLNNDFEKIVSNYGEPIADDSIIPSYYVCQEAKKHLTVILNGDGGDEIFGGYKRYVPFAKFDFFNTNIFNKGLSKNILKILPQTSDKKSIYNNIYRLIDFSKNKGLLAYLAASVDIFEGYQNYISTDEQYLNEVVTDFEKVCNNANSGLDKIMLQDFNVNLFNALLVKMDIASMAHSLEGRSPFLSKEIMEYAPTIHQSLKIKGTQTKYILREVAKKYLPIELINQPKRGFEIPLKKWMNTNLKDITNDYLTSSNSISAQFIDKKFIIGLLENKIKIPDEKRAKILFTLLTLEIWKAKVYDPII